MSKIKNSGLDQYGAEPFKHQQFGTAGIKGVKVIVKILNFFFLRMNTFKNKYTFI